MKTLTHHFCWLLCVLLSATLFSGCGGGAGDAAAKVDVSAEIQNLKSDNSETRQNACVNLGAVGPKAVAAVKPLIEALKDQDALVRRLAAYALGQVGPAAKEAFPALKEATSDQDASVATAAINALLEIDPKAAGDIKTPPNITN